MVLYAVILPSSFFLPSVVGISLMLHIDDIHILHAFVLHTIVLL